MTVASSLPAEFAAAAMEFLPPAGRPLVLGVSGGLDSMTLWDLARRDGRWPLVVCHLDHGLRPDTAADAELLRAFAARVPAAQTLRLYRCDCARLAAERGRGLEETGRSERYALYLEEARAAGAAVVALAHHRDDRAETVLMHLLRGAGPVGGQGMPARRELGAGVEVVRPLLAIGQARLRAYADVRRLPWREDPSNRDCRFLRNRIRHRVLPVLERGCPGCAAELVAQAERRAAGVRRARTGARSLLGRARDGDRLVLAALIGREPETRYLVWRELCRELELSPTRERLRRLDELAAGPVGRRLHLGHLLLRRRPEGLAWEPARGAPCLPRAGLAVPGTCDAGGWRCEVAPAPVPADPRGPDDEAWLDRAAIVGDMWWGPVVPGTRFRPLGLAGHKTVRALLADRGVPARARPAWPVLGDARGPLWVAGHALAERARITPATMAAVRVRCRGPGAVPG